MPDKFVVAVIAGVIVALAFFLLVSYILRVLTRAKSPNTKLIVGTLAAVASLLVVLPTLVYAIYSAPGL
jgi:flagellar biogenesis protein FliO